MAYPQAKYNSKIDENQEFEDNRLINNPNAHHNHQTTEASVNSMSERCYN